MKKFFRSLVSLLTLFALLACSACSTAPAADPSASSSPSSSSASSLPTEDPADTSDTPDTSEPASSSPKQTKFFDPDTEPYLTLNEAIDLACAYLEHFKLNASREDLVKIWSADENNHFTDQGIDGKRYLWSLDFVMKGASTEDENNIYTMDISGGGVSSCVESLDSAAKSMNLSGETIDSDEALEIAKDYGLQPGQTFPIGYHFDLEINSLAADEERTPYTMLTVYGQNDESSYAYVVLDAYTGEVLTASQKMTDENDESYWVDW